MFTGSMAATKSSPATRRRLWPCTPSPATTTRIVRTHSVEPCARWRGPPAARGSRPHTPRVAASRPRERDPDRSNQGYLPLDGVDLPPHVVDGYRNIAVTLALDRRRYAPQDGGRGRVTDREHGKCSISEQRIAGTDRIDQPIDEAVDHKKAVMGFVVCTAAGEHAALAQLQDQKLAPGRVIDIGGEWPNAGILIAECEPRLALVRRDEVEALKIGDVAPAARNLAVGHAETTCRERLHQFRDGAPIEDAMAKVRKHHRVGRHLPHRVDHLRQDLIGDR